MRLNPFHRSPSALEPSAPQPLPELIREQIEGAFQQLILEAPADGQILDWQREAVAEQLITNLAASYQTPEGRRLLLLDDGFSRVYEDELRSIANRDGKLAAVMAGKLGMAREAAYVRDQYGSYPTGELFERMKERSGQLTWRELMVSDPNAFADYVIGVGSPDAARTTENVLDHLVDGLFRQRLSRSVDQIGKQLIGPRNEQAWQRQRVAMAAEDAALAELKAQERPWQRDDVSREFEEYATIPPRPQLSPLEQPSAVSKAAPAEQGIEL